MAQGFYSCRNSNGGAPFILAKTKAAADTAAIIDGAPVMSTAAGDIAIATKAANIVTATAIFGFSNEDDATSLARHFPAIPAVEDHDTGLQLLNVNLASPMNIHTYPIKAGQSPARTMIGVACDIVHDATLDHYSLDPTSATNALVRIVDIPSGNVGVDGGLLDFVVLDAKSQAPGGDVAV